MCGILAALRLKGDSEQLRRRLLRLSKRQRHRGPDKTGIYQSADGTVAIAFERLQIIDTSDAGQQPFVLERPGGELAWALNSEIYNHEVVRQTALKGVEIVKHSGSDSAIVGHLYDKLGPCNELWNTLDGIFACFIYDAKTGIVTVARDPMGICPLYWGKGDDGAIWFASEMKSLQGACSWFGIFPPGHSWSSTTGQFERWYNPVWLQPSYMPTKPLALCDLRDAFIKSVVKRLMSDAPLGCLLSGGLDSSLVTAVAVRHMQESTNTFDKVHRLHTFSVGIKGAPDLAAARKVADFLGTEHHEIHFTVEEGIDALRDLIWHIESYEQVRAAVPMYLLSRQIKARGIKVVLSGEGADELFGGYLYFHKAPSAEEFHRETVRKTTRLHQWDVLRANKAPFAWGVESRVPFLDKQFIDVALTMDPAQKLIDMAHKPDGVHPQMEKYVLRKAFDLPDKPYLPDSVLWRQKEQFSDGVGYDWVDCLRDYAAKVVTDDMWTDRSRRFPDHPPTTREYYLLRSIFQEQFPEPCALDTVPKGLSIACSTPEAIAWDKEWAETHEISGRALKNVHDAGASFNLKRPTDAVVANGLHRVSLDKASLDRTAAASPPNGLLKPLINGLTNGVRA